MSRSTRAARLSDLGFTLVLTAAWILFWGELSAANLVTGAVASTVLLRVFPLGHDIALVRHRLRPMAAMRLVVEFGIEIVATTVETSRDILVGSRHERPGIVACPLRVDAPGLITFLTSLLAITPGTMPIEATQDPPVIYLHVLHLRDPERVRQNVSRLERLAVAALGSPEALAAVELPPPPPPHHTSRPTT
jgi:multicomponent Na+:H+ antiporter subunit E